MIDVHNISIKYDYFLLQNAEVQFYASTFHLITGRSGCGKSSLLYKVGLISNQDETEYEIDNKSIRQYKSSQIKRYNIGYVLQDMCLFEQYDVLGNLKLYSSFINEEYDNNRYQEILCQVSLDVPLNQPVETLSGGERQRLQIACALCKNPDILILDEPTNALDEVNERIIFDLLVKLAHEDHKCIIVASHSYYAKEYADYVYQIENNKIVNYKKTEANNSPVIHYNGNKLYKSFYYQYIRYFIKKYKYINVLMITILSILSFFIFGINSSIQYYVNDSRVKMLGLSDNQLFVIQNKNDLYVNEISEVFDSKKLEDIKKINNHISAYPYLLVRGIIDGEDILVLPYFDQNDFSEETLCYIDESNKHGAYFSFEVYKKISSQSSHLNSLDVILQTQHADYPKGFTTTNINKNIQFKAVLKENVYSSYQPDCKNYIYVYYKDLQDIYSQNISSSDIFGYTIFTQNLDEYNHLVNELKAMDIGLNYDFVNLEALNNLVDSTSNLNFIMQIVVCTLFIILICMVQLNYFYKRNREFALLSINGLNSNQILLLIMIEAITKLVMTFFISIFFISIIGYLINPFFTIYELLNIIKIIIMNYGIISIVIMLLSKIYLYKLIPEKILRK